MQGGERQDTDQDQDLEIIILPDGSVILTPEAGWVAEALGDEAAVEKCRKAMRTKVISGGRHCG